MEGQVYNTTKIKLSQVNTPVLLEMEGFPLPFCNTLFSICSLHSSAVQVTLSLVLTPALVQLQSRLMG